MLADAHYPLVVPRGLTDRWTNGSIPAVYANSAKMHSAGGPPRQAMCELASTERPRIALRHCRQALQLASRSTAMPLQLPEQPANHSTKPPQK
jgi:hypothetical protein